MDWDIYLYIVGMDRPTQSASNQSMVSLIGANLFAIFLALIENWSVQELLIIYWWQSVIIGVFNVRRMMALKTFSTDGMRQNGRAIMASKKTQKSLATFFAVHYGFFHVVYLIFILANERAAFSGNVFFLGSCVLAFLLNHYYSFVKYREEDAKNTPNIGTLFFFPYLRIFPMHLTIIAGGFLGGGSRGSLILFLGLKTVADAMMHKIEHSRWRRER